ncbi:MAG: prolipoprotein diacylglyceryl transferase [Firmicutes bacterium]|nr:prolipoprotein diacylglyceryl transferase [Bacillota bacterium]
MRRVLFSIGRLEIYSYGFMVALALLVGLIWVGKAIEKRGIGKFDLAIDIAVQLFFGGLIGARLFYIVTEYPYYLKNPLAVFRLADGGLSFFGMIIGAFIWGVLYAKRAKLPTWQLADLIAVYLPLGYALARVGCLLNGCCYGVPSKLPWAFVIPAVDNLQRHPTQVYAIIASLLIFVVLWLLRENRYFPGFLFWLYVELYAVSRFIIEFFRETPVIAFGWLRLTQAFCLLVIAGTTAYIIYRFKAKTGVEKDAPPDIPG